MKNENRVDLANKVTWTGMFVNIVLTLFKLFAGIFGTSSAMVADAFHSLSDFATDIVVLIGFRFVKKPVDTTHDYGHGKVETLSTVIIGIALFVVGLKIFWSGSSNIYRAYLGKAFPEPAMIAFGAAIFSILSKEWLYRYTLKTGKAINSQAVIANAWHHRSDAFSSIGTMIGIGGAIFLGEKWHILDPIAAVIVSFFILKTAFDISRNGLSELMEASLSDEKEALILEVAEKVPGVVSPHEVKTRRIGNYVAIDLHIQVAKDLNITKAHDISTEVEDRLKETFGEETFVSVHVEPKE